MSRRSFHRYCYACNNYGHKDDECGSKVNRNSLVLEHNIVCYKCNNMGHKANYYISGFAKPLVQKKVESHNQQKKRNEKV